MKRLMQQQGSCTSKHDHPHDQALLTWKRFFAIYADGLFMGAVLGAFIVEALAYYGIIIIHHP